MSVDDDSTYTVNVSKIAASGVQQVTKEYIHFDCPFCPSHMFVTCEDGDSTAYEACGHYKDFEWDADNDEWVATFTKGKY